MRAGGERFRISVGKQSPRGPNDDAVAGFKFCSYRSRLRLRTLVLAIELSNKNWVLAAQVPGLPQTRRSGSIEPTAEALLAAIEGYRRTGQRGWPAVERVIAIYEAGWSGFWLARWLATHEIETHVVQPSSVPVDRRARRAKSDGIDAELLLRTLLAWLRGEPRVCSMVPIPVEADEDARRCVARTDGAHRRAAASLNGIGGVLATLGVRDYNPLRRIGVSASTNCARRLGRRCRRMPAPRSAECSTAGLVLAQIAELEQERDAVLEEGGTG